MLSFNMKKYTFSDFLCCGEQSVGWFIFHFNQDGFLGQKEGRDILKQGPPSQLTWGPPEVESGSGWAASNIPQKKGAQLTQS